MAIHTLLKYPSMKVKTPLEQLSPTRPITKPMQRFQSFAIPYPPTLIVSSPIDYEVTDATSIDVEGRTTDIRFHELTINGTVVPVSNEQFIHPVSLDFGNNVIVVEATDTVGNAQHNRAKRHSRSWCTHLGHNDANTRSSRWKTPAYSLQGTAHDANLETLTINGQIANSNRSRIL